MHLQSLNDATDVHKTAEAAVILIEVGAQHLHAPERKLRDSRFGQWSLVSPPRVKVGIDRVLWAVSAHRSYGWSLRMNITLACLVKEATCASSMARAAIGRPAACPF